MRRAFASILLAMSGLAYGQSIQTAPGPGGNTRIMTPWGDYVAIQQAGTLFVIPESEYAKGLIRDYARKNNQEEVNLVGMGKTYVRKDSVSIHVGNIRLREVAATIVIGVPASKKLGRPPKPKSSEYVQFVWVQQGSGKVSARLAIDGKTFAPNSCGSNMGFFNCEFTVAHRLLAMPATAIFLQDRSAPGIWQMESLARTHYDGLKRKYAELKMPLDKEDAADMAAIRAIDPSLPDDLLRTP